METTLGIYAAIVPRMGKPGTDLSFQETAIAALKGESSPRMQAQMGDRALAFLETGCGSAVHCR